MKCEKCVEMLEYVCDKLCRWPWQLGEEELREKCEECRLNEMFEDGGCASGKETDERSLADEIIGKCL